MHIALNFAYCIVENNENSGKILTIQAKCDNIYKSLDEDAGIFILGYSQAVRQRTLTPSFRWFESTYPSQSKGSLSYDSGLYILGCRQAVRHLTLTQAFPGFESLHPSQTISNLNSPYFVFIGGLFGIVIMR